MTHLSANQIQKFNQEGFLVVNNIFDSENVIDPIIDEYATVLDDLANYLYSKGKISSNYS